MNNNENTALKIQTKGDEVYNTHTIPNMQNPEKIESMAFSQDGKKHLITKDNVDEYKNIVNKDNVWDKLPFWSKLLLICRAIFLIPEKGSICGDELEVELMKHNVTLTANAHFGSIDSNFTDNTSQVQATKDYWSNHLKNFMDKKELEQSKSGSGHNK